METAGTLVKIVLQVAIAYWALIKYDEKLFFCGNAHRKIGCSHALKSDNLGTFRSESADQRRQEREGGDPPQSPSYAQYIPPTLRDCFVASAVCT